MTDSKLLVSIKRITVKAKPTMGCILSRQISIVRANVKIKIMDTEMPLL